MSNKHQQAWDQSNIVDNVCFQETDAELFRNLLEGNCRIYQGPCRHRCRPKI